MEAEAACRGEFVDVELLRPEYVVEPGLDVGLAIPPMLAIIPPMFVFTPCDWPAEG